MNDEKAFEAKIGEAWKTHYQGDQAAAIEQFKRLVDEAPDHVDALWGLGLSYRKAGDLENARQAFEHARDLVQAALDEQPEEYGRLFMLNRMIKQQLEYISDFIQ